SPTPTPPPSPEKVPPPSAAAFFPAVGTLASGRQFMTRSGVAFSLDLAKPGWISQQGFELMKGTLAEPTGIDILFWDGSPTNTYADPCARTPRVPAVGSGLEAMAAAVAAAPGTDLVSAPTDLQIGRGPANATV